MADNAVNALVDTRTDANAVDEHARIKKWIDENPRAARGAALALGGVNGLFLQAPSNLLDLLKDGNPASQLRSSYPATYRAANYGATAPWWIGGAVVGGGASMNALLHDPQTLPTIKRAASSDIAKMSLVDIARQGVNALYGNDK